eukprot:TRINITY_DN5397_c0_g1_i2.p3 TRINITY_DN5397_c0_g1~~TRINITY_DN5397_c0_g1_i2.p3  ORF type:complete len:115 (+),score=12.68 TRINITY_DN5397_c0_g1_i2:318-662(+)
MGCLEERDKTVGPGFKLAGDHFDVHRFHPPLVYGRRGGPEDGEGIAYCRVKSKVNDQYVHFVITYVLPIISARAVPQMVEFAKKFSKFLNVTYSRRTDVNSFNTFICSYPTHSL